MVDLLSLPTMMMTMPASPPSSFLERDNDMDDIDLISSTDDAMYDLVCRLSAACKANCNVLVDNALVDALETRGKALMQDRGRAKSPTVAKMLQLSTLRATRYDTLPVDSYYSQKQASFEPMERVVPVILKPTSSLETFQLDEPMEKPHLDLAASSASTFSTASMAPYMEDEASDSDEEYADSVMTLSPFSRCMSMLEMRPMEGSEEDLDAYGNVVHSLQDQIDQLLLENCQIVAENARLAEISDMTAAEVEMLAAKNSSAEALLRTQSERLMSVETSQASAADRIRAEMRAEFEAELAKRTQEVASLQSEVAGKNSEISRLSQQVNAISVAIEHKADGAVEDGANSGSEDINGLIATLRKNNVVKETEILEMQETLLQKDREICSLYMHLSTKKKLIEEITRSFVENMAQVSNEPTGDVRIDVDTCLFKSVVDKEKRLDQLTAALSAMEQEVEALESRIAAKELEKHTLQSHQQLLGRTLQGMKAKLSQVLAEKGELDAALSASQARVATLMDTLAQKDQQLRAYSQLSLSMSGGEGLAPMTTF